MPEQALGDDIRVNGAIGVGIREGSKAKRTRKVQLVEILNKPLESLKGEALDLTPYGTEERYRFVDCEAYVNEHTLRICETTRLPSSHSQYYSTISYVWFALPASPEELSRDGYFRVFCGARDDGTVRDDGGPISMKVLEYACLWSIRSSAPYLWLDRLCILQTSKHDKFWQISRMYDIFQGCEECIVLPGGLQRLASVYDETTWADRAWTYQETILTWDYAVVLTRDWHRPEGEQHWFVEGECHWQYLQMLFIEGSQLLTSQIESVGDNRVAATIKDPRLILGKNKRSLDTLNSIVLYKAWNYLNEEDKQIDSFVIDQLVLQGVQMRISSRPVDMVLSILGLVGMEEEFEMRMEDFGENERFHATLALVELMLREQDEAEPGESAFLDIPLWATLESAEDSSNDSSDEKDVRKMLSLEELAGILDNAEERRSCRAVRLERWEYELKYEQETTRAQDIVDKIPDATLLAVYHGEKDRVTIEHEDEGHMELRRSLDIKSRNNRSDDAILDTFVFAWALKWEGHPIIRFYKLGLKDLLE